MQPIIDITKRIAAWDLRYKILLGACIGLLAFIVVLWVIVRPEGFDQKIAFARMVIGIVGGGAVLFGLYFTWQGQQLTMKGLADNQETALGQLHNAQKQLDLTRQGQIVERFESAIAQLGETSDDGNPRLEIRLGGIYALERIAKDSIEYYGPVMEVLTAYVRQNAPCPHNQDTEQDSASEPRPTADIQAILDVLVRRAEDRVPEQYRVRLDLQDTDLRRARLYGLERREEQTKISRANLREAAFFRANLSSTQLTGADLQRAGFVAANLQFADLREADLRGAHISNADLQGTQLQRANLRGADFQRANLDGVRLDRVDLRETIFRGIHTATAASLFELVGDEANKEVNLQNAHLPSADLRGVDLRNADLRNAFLSDAKLQKTQLQGADLRKAFLLNAELQEAKLDGADLRDANLKGADLEGAEGVTIEQLEQQTGLLEGATMPNGMKHN